MHVQTLAAALGVLAFVGFVVVMAWLGKREIVRLEQAWAAFAAANGYEFIAGTYWGMGKRPQIRGVVAGLPIEIELYGQKGWATRVSLRIAQVPTVGSAAMSDAEMGPGAARAWAKLRAQRPRSVLAPHFDGNRIAVAFPGHEKDPAILQLASELLVAIVHRTPRDVPT